MSVMRRALSSCCLLALTVLPATATGAEGNPHGAELERCGGVGDDRERLRCFDDLVERMREGGASAAGGGGQAGEDAEDGFGSETLKSSKPEPQDDVRSISARLERVEQRPHGQYVFHLSNGQVWTELSAGRRRYSAGVDVTIERTALGGYMLSTGVGRATRVRRVE